MQLTLKERKERSEKFPPNSVQATKSPVKFSVLDVQLLPGVGNKGLQLQISHLELQHSMGR